MILGVWGPSLAAIIVTAIFHGKDGLKRFFGRLNFKEGLKWFLPLLGFFLVIGLAGGYIGAAASGIEYNPKFWGWAWVALVIAFFHLLWHAPTYWLGQGMHNVPALWAVFFLLPVTILFTWAYNKSNGSILVSIFFHATLSATLSFAAFLPSEDVVPLSPELLTMTWLPDGLMEPYLGVAVLYWVLAVYVLRGGFGGLGTPPEFEHPIEER